MTLVDEWGPGRPDVWCELYADAPARPEPFAPLPPARPVPPARRSSRHRQAVAGILLALDDRSVPARWAELTHNEGVLAEVRWTDAATDACLPCELEALAVDLGDRLRAWADRAYLPPSPLEGDES